MSGPVVRASTREFYLARVEQARAEADAATLDHVRERCRRSEAAWQALADKAGIGERMREAEALRRAESWSQVELIIR